MNHNAIAWSALVYLRLWRGELVSAMLRGSGSEDCCRQTRSSLRCMQCPVRRQVACYKAIRCLGSPRTECVLCLFFGAGEIRAIHVARCWRGDRCAAASGTSSVYEGRQGLVQKEAYSPPVGCSIVYQKSVVGVGGVVLDHMCLLHPRM